jgi:transposase
LATESDHRCEWREQAETLRVELVKKDAEIAQLGELLAKRNDQIDTLVAQVTTLTTRVDQVERKLAQAEKKILGPQRERMPTPEDEAKAREGKKPRGGHVNPKKRSENKEALARLPTTVVPHPIPDDERRCPHCGELVEPISDGESSEEYEWIPGRLERRIHVVEVGRCPCKQHYARGPAPSRVQEGCKYGPAFLAKLAIDRCGDATPIYRVEKNMRRTGIPISRSTMNDLVLLAGELLTPLWLIMQLELRADPYVQADETSCKTQVRTHRCFIWTFLSKHYTVYVFSPTRSGETPNDVLGGTKGNLAVDGYTGYNHVTDVDGRDRSGCWSHARRYLFEALPKAPEARAGLDIILELFMIEREAVERGIAGSAEHLELRQSRSAKVHERFREWRDSVTPLFEPSSAMGEALRYINNQWSRLSAFLGDARIPLHNNASEAALRIIALMRKNSLFFGNDDAARKYGSSAGSVDA